MLTAIDLCCGAGGWACAARGLPIRFVAVADHAADCLETWGLNHAAAHPECQQLEVDLASPKGMRQVLKAARGVDLILGAIPCEQLSQARANRPLKPGELEGVHEMIDQCFAAVKRLRPRWWCFEDVTAVEGHLPTPLHWGIPYECRRINAADYGPQRRTRTFFGRFPPPAPPEPGPRTLGEVLRPGPYRTLPKLAQYERSTSKWYGQGEKKKLRVQDPEGKGATAISSQGRQGSNAERSGMVPVARVLDAGQACPTVADYGSRHERAALVSAGRPLFNREQVCDPEEAARTVIGSHDGRHMQIQEAELVRVLEWQEAATLQGFDSDYVFAASWSRTWKLVAQAIPIYVGRAILRAIVADWEAHH